MGNWPGVTVEKEVGKCMYKGAKLEIVDLPGTYSLTAHSIEVGSFRTHIYADAGISCICAREVIGHLIGLS